MRIPSLAFVQSCSCYECFYSAHVFHPRPSHLISSASVFSQCIPPLLQDLHFQLLYKLLLVLIQPYLLLLQLEKPNKSHLVRKSICAAAPHVFMRNPGQFERKGARAGSCFQMTACQDMTGSRCTPGCVYLDLWSRHQQHDAPRVFA